MPINPNEFEVVNESPDVKGKPDWSEFESVPDPKALAFGVQQSITMPALAMQGLSIGAEGVDPTRAFQERELRRSMGRTSLMMGDPGAAAGLEPEQELQATKDLLTKPVQYAMEKAHEAVAPAVSDFLNKSGIDPSSTPEKVLNLPRVRAEQAKAFSQTLGRSGHPILGTLVQALPGAAAGVANLGLSTTESLAQPEQAGLALASGGSSLFAKAAAFAFAASQFADLPDEIKEAIKVIKDPEKSTADKVEAAGKPGVGAILGAVMLKHGMTPEPPAGPPLLPSDRKLMDLAGKPGGITGADLELPGRIPATMRQPLTPGLTVPDMPAHDRPVVPETAPEPGRETGILREIVNNVLITRRQVQDHFRRTGGRVPGNEEASSLLKKAWKREEPIDAIPQRSTEEVHVAETPGDREKVVEGVRPGEEPAVPQEPEAEAPVQAEALRGQEPVTVTLPGADKPIGAEPTPSNIDTAAKLTGDLASAKALTDKGFESLGVDVKKKVLSVVSSAIGEDKVFSAIVESVPVDVMADLTGKKGATKLPLKDKAMLIDALTSKGGSDPTVSAPVGRFIDNVLASAPVREALRSTEKVPVSTGVEKIAGEAVPAKVAGGVHEPIVSKKAEVSPAQPTPPAAPGGTGVEPPTAPGEAKIDSVDSFEKFLEDPKNKASNKHSIAAGLSAKTPADLDRLLAMSEKYKAAQKKAFEDAQDPKLTPTEKLKLLEEGTGLGNAYQLSSEAIQAATNTGSWVEAEAMGESDKLGPRPMDWKTSKAGADWLREHSDRIAFKLPDEIKKPAEPVKPTEPVKPAEAAHAMDPLLMDVGVKSGMGMVQMAGGENVWRTPTITRAQFQKLTIAADKVGWHPTNVLDVKGKGVKADFEPNATPDQARIMAIKTRIGRLEMIAENDPAQAEAAKAEITRLKAEIATKPAVSETKPATTGTKTAEGATPATEITPGMSIAQKEEILGPMVKDKILNAPSFPKLVAASKSFQKSLGSQPRPDYEAFVSEQPWDLLSEHSGVLSAKSARAKTLKSLADAVIREADLPMQKPGRYRGMDYRIDWDKLGQSRQQGATPTVAPAAAKVEAEVAKVAATEGQRPAKDVKAELVSSIQEQIEAAPSEEAAFKAAIEKAGAKVELDAKKYEKQKADILNQIPKVTIDIPGDGKFTIVNTKENLTELLARAKAISTAAGAPVKVTRRGVSGEQAKAFAAEAAITPSLTEKVSEKLDKLAQDAKDRINKRGEGTTFGSGPLHELPNIRDYAIWGAARLAKFGLDKARFFAEMVNEFGKRITPHLERLYAESLTLFNRHTEIEKAKATPVQQIIDEASGAATAPKDTIRQIVDTLQSGLKTVRALKDHFTDAPQVSRAEVKLADDFLEADANRIKESLTELVKRELPPSERGIFITAINNATRRSPLLTGDPEAMYRHAAEVAGRIEDRGIEVQKKTAINTIKENVTKAIASPTVDLKFKGMIGDMVKQFSFTKPTEATLAKLRKIRDYLDSQEQQGHNVDMPKAVLESLELLNKTPIKDLPLHVLEAMRDRIALLEEMGRRTVANRELRWENEKAAKNRELAGEESNPIEKRPEFSQGLVEGASLTQKIRNFVNRRLDGQGLIDKALLPIDPILDLLGDAKGTYKGWLFKHVRNPLDLDFNSAIVARDRISKPLLDIIKKNGLNEESSRRVGVYAALQQEGGRERLMAMGATAAELDKVERTLSPAERSAYNSMRAELDKLLPQVQKLMHELYNIPVEPVENYFPMPRDWPKVEIEPKAPDQPKFGEEMAFDELGAWNDIAGDYERKTTKTEQGMTIERLKRAKTAIRIDAFEVFQQHINDVTHLLATQRDIKMIGELAKGDLFESKYGKVGQSLVLSWLDTFARQGRLTGLHRWNLLDTLRKNTSVGVIGFRLASQFVHLSNVPLGMERAGPINYASGLMESVTPEGQQFLKDNFAETFARGGGEPDLVQAMKEGGSVFGKQIVPKSAVRLGFLFARAIDQKNAQATALGVYFKELKAKGKDPAQYASMPVDKEAQAQALVMTRRAVASPLPKDVPMVLSRGALTGGNVSLGRAAFQFQNIFLDQWSNIRYDVPAYLRNNPVKAARLTFALITMIGAETLIRETAKEAIRSATGYKPKKEPSTGAQVFTEVARRFPFVSQLMAMALRPGAGVPILDSAKDVATGAHAAITGKTERASDRGAIRAVAGAAQLGGIPGASQVGELIEKSQ